MEFSRSFLRAHESRNEGALAPTVTDPRSVKATGTISIRVRWGLVLAGVMALASAARAASIDFAERLQNMISAVDAHVAAQPNEADRKRFPASIRRVAWVDLNNDKLADAIVVLKSRRSECAVTADDKRYQCRGLVLFQNLDGQFRVAFDFPLLSHPLMIAPQRDGPLQLYLTDSALEDPPYTRYDFSGTAFSSAAKVTRAQARDIALLEFDDRAMPLIEAEKTAGANPKNSQARLSPFTLLIDNVNPGYSITNMISTVVDERFMPRILPSLSDDAAKITSVVGWPMTLDIRLLACPDWPVLRRFWEIEGARNGKIAICTSGIAFWDTPIAAERYAAQKLQLPSEMDRIDAVRYRLLYEIGVAYLLRAVPFPVATRMGITGIDDRQTLTRLAAGIGVLIGEGLKIQTFEQAQRAAALWDATVELWFRVYEVEERSWTTPTPELRAFIFDLRDRNVGLNCARRVQAKAGPGAVNTEGACPETTYTLLNDINSHFKNSRAP